MASTAVIKFGEFELTSQKVEMHYKLTAEGIHFAFIDVQFGEYTFVDYETDASFLIEGLLLKDVTSLQQAVGKTFDLKSQVVTFYAFAHNDCFQCFLKVLSLDEGILTFEITGNGYFSLIKSEYSPVEFKLTVQTAI